MNVTVKMFGAFRALGESLDISLPAAATTADLSAQIAQRITDHPALIDLLPVSKFATDIEILATTTPLTPGEAYAILPPVSGG